MLLCTHNYVDSAQEVNSVFTHKPTICLVGFIVILFCFYELKTHIYDRDEGPLRMR